MPEVRYSGVSVTWNDIYMLWDGPWHPRDFTAVVPEGNTAVLSWKPFLDWLDYTVERESFEEDVWVQDKSFVVTATNTLDDVETTDTLGGGLYRYRIRASRSIE